MTIDELLHESHETACSKGWWDQPREIPELLMLTVSELSESLEEYREHGHDRLRDIYYTHADVDGRTALKPEGFAVELADVLIRIGDFCRHFDIPLEESLAKKLAFNQLRPYRHNKVC